MRGSLARVTCTLLLASPVLACGGQERPVPDVEDPASTVQPAAVDTVPPVAGSGQFAAHTPDPGQISGEWPVNAGECDDPPSLHLLVDGDSVGVLLVLGYPDSAPRLGTYRVSAGPPGPPTPGTARFSVQRILYVGLAYRGVDGVVELEQLGRQVSGRFDVRLEEATTERETRYVGTFRDVRVGPWDADLCVMSRPDSAVADKSR